MQLSAIGNPEPVEGGVEDAWYGSNRLRTLKNGEVVWTVGTGRVMRRYSRTYSGIREPQSIFTVFEGEVCACTLIGDVVQVNSQSGADWDISLPFRGLKMWANPLGGLLVERWLPFNKKDVGEDEPLLFSVSHPLDEAKPVELGRHEELAWVVEAAPFVFTYSVERQAHNFYRLDRTSESEMDVENIRSEYVLTLVRTFSSEEWPERMSKAFLANTVVHDVLLCVLIPSFRGLYQFALDGSSAADAVLKEVIDATAVNGSTENDQRDIVVLREDSTMHLYRGSFQLCELVPTALGKRVQVARFQKFASPNEGLDLILTNSTKIRVLVMAAPRLVAPVCQALIQAAKLASPLLGLALLVDVAVRSDLLNEFDTFVSLFKEVFRTAPQPNVPRSSFDLLLQSDFNAKYMDKDLFSWRKMSKNLPSSSRDIPSSTVEQRLLLAVVNRGGSSQLLADFFLKVHLVYETFKLDVLQYAHLRDLASFLGGLANKLFPPGFACVYDDFYRRDLGREYSPISFGEYSPIVSSTSPVLNMAPPDVFEELFRAISGISVTGEAIPWFGSCRQLLNVFQSWRQKGDIEAALEMVRCGIDLNRVATFPVGIQVVLREMLHRCRETPPANPSRELAALISREDIFLSHASSHGQAIRRFQGDVQRRDSSLAASSRAQHDDDDDHNVLQRATRLRFGRDHRIKEVFKLLDSSTGPLLVVKRKPEMTDHDLIKAQQVKLKQLICKSMAGTIGRGALMLFTKRNVHEKTVHVPELAKAGKLPPQNVQVQLDDAHQVKSNWPAFHNGVAAGLSRVQRDAASSSTKDLTRSWILFNKAKPPTDSHAGILLALGLNKDLSTLTMADTFEHIEPGHELTSIAMLLGLGCAKAGSCDPSIRKTLTLHVPSLFPQEFSDLDVVPATVQAAALAGLGLLYRGTCNRLMSEFLLEEMIKSPASDAVVEQRGSYSLSAGLALGMVALGYGAIEGGLAGLADLQIEDRLNILISGGPVTKFAHQVHAFVDEDDELASHKVAPVAARQGAAGADSRNMGINGLPSAEREPKCSRVLEGDYVNTEVTSPGATMALGLIYLKSNDASAGAKLAPPSTRFLLENVRPDFLMYKLWARCLVLWDAVVPDLSWVMDQIPLYVDPRLATDHQDQKFLSQSRAYLVAGAALGIGCRFAGTTSRLARDCLLEIFHMGGEACDAGDSSSMEDAENERMSLDLKKGTSPRKKRVSIFQDVGFVCADACYSAIAIALGLVMAGSGDLETLRTLRAFRKSSKRYGTQQLAGMALGFLFMGGGKISFARTNEAIAGIVCSVLPILADSPEDNSGYLQALRHLYVLATEPRSVEAFDADSGQACYAPLEVKLHTELPLGELSSPTDLDDLFVSPSKTSAGDEEEKHTDATPNDRLTINLVAPALLPPLEYIQSIRVASPRYWPLVVQPSKLPQELVVKLRGDQLPYHIDPRGLSCLSARPRPKAGAELLGSLRDFAGKSPYVLAFAKFLPYEFETLYDCLVQDSVDALPAIMEIASVQRLGRMNPLQAVQLRFLKRYYESSQSKNLGRRLVPDRLLHFELRGNRDVLRTYVENGKANGADESFIVYLNLAGIPKWGRLAQLKLLVSPQGVANAVQMVDADALLELSDACL